VLLLLELGLRISEAVGADVEDLGEPGPHRVLKLKGKGQTTKVTVAPLNAAVAHAVDRAKGARTKGPLLITSTGEGLTRQHAGKLIKRMGANNGAYTDTRSIGVDAATLSRRRSIGLFSARKLEGVRLQPNFDEAARTDVPCAVPPLTCSGEDVVAVKARHLDRLPDNTRRSRLHPLQPLGSAER
jgi:hypothetical protein